MIIDYKMYLVNAFSNKPFKGNSTGVVINDGSMSGETMQNIAKDLNQSETVFVSRLDVERYQTRFFTSEKELDLCGHATIATFFSLADQNYIKPIEDGVKEIIQHTGCGKIKVELEYSDYQVQKVYMYLDELEIREDIDRDFVARMLNISPDDIGLPYKELNPKKVYTKLNDIVVPVKSLEVLESIIINEEEMREYSIKNNIVSFQVFTTDDGNVINQRTFSPSIGIYEECGSGSSTGATLYYMVKNGINSSNKIRVVQGAHLNRQSALTAEYCSECDMVKVGGRAFVFLNGVLSV